nr:hypothetical protein [Tanacetum cinerariifolium]
MSQECLVMFAKFMSSSGLVPDGFGLRLVVKACGRIRGVKEGGMVHGLVLKFGFGLDLFVLSSLVSMYAKFGDVGSARRVFDGMGKKERDVVTWNALLDGYVKCGEVDVAKELFDEMGVKDVVSWTVMVDGLAKSGRVDEARRIFDEMPFRNVAKCSSIESALKVFETIPNKKLGHWTAIIVGLGIHGLAKHALELFSMMLTLNIIPNAITFIGVLNACNHAGLVDDGRRYFDMMVNEYRIEPTIEHYGCFVDILCRAGCLEEAKNVIEKMPMKPNKIIWMSLLSASRIYKNVEIGEYAANHVREIDPKYIEILLHIDGDDAKVAELESHSERLAIAFGLINMKQGIPIRIVKNLRVCNDCHSVTKLLSKVYNREIIVRDNSRFHHFKNGSCSCMDYW